MDVLLYEIVRRIIVYIFSETKNKLTWFDSIAVNTTLDIYPQSKHSKAKNDYMSKN